jgi:hypothetical protein
VGLSLHFPPFLPLLIDPRIVPKNYFLDSPVLDYVYTLRKDILSGGSSTLRKPT